MPNENSCFHCNTKEGKLRYCGRCFLLKYCSPECQLKDWSSHKLLCKKITMTKHLGKTLHKLEYGFLVKLFDKNRLECPLGFMSKICSERLEKELKHDSDLINGNPILTILRSDDWLNVNADNLIFEKFAGGDLVDFLVESKTNHEWNEINEARDIFTKEIRHYGAGHVIGFYFLRVQNEKFMGQVVLQTTVCSSVKQ